MANKTVHKTTTKDNTDSKLFAFLGVLLTVIGYIIVVLARKNDKYAMYYAKQGLVLFIAWVVVAVASWAVGWIPVAGDVASWVLNAIMLALWIIGIIYALSGKEKEIPIVGPFAKKI
jgi:uncharacterized membrane protein